MVSVDLVVSWIELYLRLFYLIHWFIFIHLIVLFILWEVLLNKLNLFVRWLWLAAFLSLINWPIMRRRNWVHLHYMIHYFILNMFILFKPVRFIILNIGSANHTKRCHSFVIRFIIKRSSWLLNILTSSNSRWWILWQEIDSTSFLLILADSISMWLFCLNSNATICTTSRSDFLILLQKRKINILLLLIHLLFFQIQIYLYIIIYQKFEKSILHFKIKFKYKFMEI